MQSTQALIDALEMKLHKLINRMGDALNGNRNMVVMFWAFLILKEEMKYG